MRVGMRMARPVLGVALYAALTVVPAQAETLHLAARTLFDRAVSTGIVLSEDGSTLELKSGEIIQDDGPAAGFSYKPSQETLTPGVEIRKQLLIPRPRASKAVLMLSGGGELTVSVNGMPQKLGPPREITYEQWQAYDLDPAALRPGLNDIVISGRGTVRIARADDSYADLPHRSARRADRGKPWGVDRLGPAGNVAGEYYVRISLEHFVASGTLLLPVMDVANLQWQPLAPPLVAPGPLQVSVSSAKEPAGGVTLRVRSGTTYAPKQETWSGWMPLGRDGRLESPRGRFVQVEVKLATTDPLVTAKLTGITLTAVPKLANDWTKALKVVGSHNEEIVRTSIPFQYEPYSAPKLKELRAKYHLDDVVRGAKSEFDIIAKLAAWSTQQWKWREWHLDDFYPPWDALEILKKMPDGKPVGGFCQQYDLVFLQACESFGFVGRDISISSGTLGRPTMIGHEPMEIWSNQFRKWIWVDSTGAFYPQDSATGVPLSLWEMRRRQIRVLRGQPVEPTRIVHIIDTHSEVGQWRGLDADISFAELRLIPRSNFLEQKWPLPLNNGRWGWNWPGFEVWTDKEVPAQPIYPNLVTRHGNFEWTLNQAHFALEPTSTAGEFHVHLDTETPGFATFVAEIDGGNKANVPAVFPWKLHAGRNRLKVWPRNDAGRDGIASWIDVDMPSL